MNLKKRNEIPGNGDDSEISLQQQQPTSNPSLKKSSAFGSDSRQQKCFFRKFEIRLSLVCCIQFKIVSTQKQKLCPPQLWIWRICWGATSAGEERQEWVCLVLTGRSVVEYWTWEPEWPGFESWRAASFVLFLFPKAVKKKDKEFVVMNQC